MKFIFLHFVLTALLVTALIKPGLANAASNKFWKVQSIDTTKYSRDLSREKKEDSGFDNVIEDQVEKMSDTGVSHIAVGTPYDSEFLPFLKRWVAAIRKKGLSVWFRGNWSGWESWFEYPSISKEEHIEKTKNFILSNPDLFEDGDIFSSCTECENGKNIDPRKTGNVEEYRKFLIALKDISTQSFQKINKKVESNYFSMNGDVARLVMDPATTRQMNGIVVIDHYVETPTKLVEDIDSIASKSQGKIILGEIGVPIPDIHGGISEEAQKNWMSEALEKLWSNPNIVGLNYWVGFGGSTSLWRENGEPKPVVTTITNFFSPKVATVKVINELGIPIADAEVEFEKIKYTSSKEGIVRFFVPYETKANVRAKTYNDLTIEIQTQEDNIAKLKKNKEGIIFRILKLLYGAFQPAQS